MKVLKYILAAIMVLCGSLFLLACEKGGGTEGGNNNYPKGAVALTMENFEDYFDVKTTATCEYNFYDEATEAVAYVAIVPKADYTDAVGKVFFNVDTRVYQWLGNNKFKISNQEQYILFDEKISNGSYKATIQLDGEYRIDSESVGVTLSAVEGYVIPTLLPEEKNELENLTDEQKSASVSVIEEISPQIEAFKTAFQAAESFTYYIGSNYTLTSIYGAGKTEKKSQNGYNYYIDKKNSRFETRNGKYYLDGGSWYHQMLMSGINLVLTERSGMDMDTVLEDTTPVWQLIDLNATYLKTDDGKYTAYVSLWDMQDGFWKDQIKSALSGYGVTTGYGRFVVTYKYDFTDGKLDFYIHVSHSDPRYPVEYYDVTYELSQKLSALNVTTVELYTPQTHEFMLADSFEDAKLFNNGLIEVDGSTKSFSYKTYTTSDYGYDHPDVVNYLPIRILEGGVYNFTPDKKTVTLLNEDGRVHGHYDRDNYFPAGLYYLKSNYVSYGLDTVTVTVDSRIYEDYGDLYDPSGDILDENTFECLFEGNGDVNVLTFNPTKSGIYDFGDHDHVAIDVYESTNLDAPVESAWAPRHAFVLEAGKNYVLSMECVNYGDRADPFTYSGSAKYVGAPTTGTLPLTEQWQDVVIYGDLATFLITPTEVGSYYVEYELLDGMFVNGGGFYTEDGKYYSRWKSVTVDGKDIYAYSLDRVSYTYSPSVYMNDYFKGRIRLVCYEKGVTESSALTLYEDKYTTITTSSLNTEYSSSTFIFTIDKAYKLLVTVDSDFFAVYDQNGKKYGTSVFPTYTDTAFGGVETKYISRLEKGTYTIVFKIDEYSDPGIKTAAMRLFAL